MAGTYTVSGTLVVPTPPLPSAQVGGMYYGLQGLSDYENIPDVWK